ncbi:gp53-like domain-containing protein, partial [Escherichia coli]
MTERHWLSACYGRLYEVSNITVTWPVAFPNAVFQVITGGSSDVGGAGQ